MMTRLVIFIQLLLLSSATMAAPSQSQRDAALADVAAEEMVFDASWTSLAPAVLMARVFDNGSHRGSYAGYLCMILGVHGIIDVTVNVVDVASKEYDVLGSAYCRELTR